MSVYLQCNARHSLRAIFLLCVLALSPVLLFAQNRSTAELVGTVTDPSGAVVAGVKVAVENVTTHVVVNVQTNDAGFYDAPLLPPGVYTVTFARDGFQTEKRSEINLALDQTARIDVQLSIGATQSVIEVKAATPLIETDNSERGTNFSTDLTQNLPLIGRDPSKLAILSAGTSTAQQDLGGADPGRVNVNGNRAFTVQATVNGGSAVLPNSNNFSAFVPPLGAVSEFSVIQDNFSSEFGNGTSVLNMITKSGTNQFHGSLFEFLENDKLNARYTFSDKKDKLRYNQFGGTIGGPIMKDKLFFFFSYQNTLNPNTGSALVTVPTNEAKSGNFSGLGTVVIDPTTGRPFAGNQIPEDRIDPVAKAALAYWPDANRSGTTDNYYTVQPNSPHSPYYDAKVDYLVNSNQQLSATFHLFDWSTDHTGLIPGPACYGGEYCGREGTRDQQWQLSHRWVLSPVLINELHANFVREHYETTSPSYAQDFAGKLGLNNVPGYYFPSFSIGGELPTSLGPGQHYSGTQNNYILGDNLIWVKGRHTLKIGGQYMASQQNPHGDWGPGSFNFSGLFSGLGFADFLLGLPDSYSLDASPQSLGARRKSAAGFVQDNWRILSNLTLNLGVRYQFEGGFTEAHNRLSNFDPAAINPVTGTPGAIVYASSSDPYLQANHTKLFAPRIGLAYSAPMGVVVRAAYGIFFIPNGAQQGFNTGVPGYSISQRLETTDQKTPVFQLSVGPPPYTYPDASTRNGAISNGSRITWFPYNAPQPYVQQWQFSLQKQLGTQTMIEAAYVANKGTFLLSPRDMNQVPIGLLGPNMGDSQLLRPFPQFSQITEKYTDGVSTYNSLQIKANRRLENGLTFLANYTFSKSLDTSSYDSTTGIGNTYQITTNTALEKGLSQFDQTHRLVLSYVYELPAGKGRRWMDRGGIVNAILGGWQNSGSFVAHSGIPFTVFSGAPNRTGAISGYVYADCIADPSVSSPSAAEWFNTAAFTDPPPYRFGTCGRNTVRGPGSWNFDAALMKNFKIPQRFLETSTLQFRADAFNIFNHANLRLPNNTTGSTAFGRITSASDARVFEVGLQLLF